MLEWLCGLIVVSSGAGGWPPQTTVYSGPQSDCDYMLPATAGTAPHGLCNTPQHGLSVRITVSLTDRQPYAMLHR